LVFYGVDNTGFTPLPWAAGSTSLLCVKPPTRRLGAPANSGGAFGRCNGSFVINRNAFQLANPSALGNPWVAGDTVFVQSWYRDPLAVKTSNPSNALELTLRNPPPLPCVTPIPGMVVIPAGTLQCGAQRNCLRVGVGFGTTASASQPLRDCGSTNSACRPESRAGVRAGTRAAGRTVCATRTTEEIGPLRRNDGAGGRHHFAARFGAVLPKVQIERANRRPAGAESETRYSLAIRSSSRSARAATGEMHGSRSVR